MRKLIGLGHRCDVAFQLRMHSGDNTAHFFDWLACPPSAVIRVLDRNFDVFHPDHLQRRDTPHDHLVDRMTGVYFWHQFPMRDAQLIADPLEFYAAFSAKFAYLAQRFRETVTHSPVTLVRRGIEHAEAERLESAFFARFPGADARFLYLTNKRPGFATTAGHSAYLSEDDGSLGDPDQWARLLVAENLVDAPYRLCTADILGADGDHNLGFDDRFEDDQLRRGIEAGPEQIGFRMELARQQIKRGDLTDAADTLHAAEVLAGQDSDIAIERLIVEWRLDRLPSDAAATHLIRSGLPRHTTQPHHYVQLLIDAGRGARARHACNLFLRHRAFDAHLYLLKARGCLIANMLREAERAIERAIVLEPGHTEALAVHATVLSRLVDTRRMVSAAMSP